MSIAAASRSARGPGAQGDPGASQAHKLSFEDEESPQPLPSLSIAGNLFEKHADALRAGTANVCLMSLSTLVQADFREPRNRLLFYLAGGHQSLKHLLTQNRLADMGNAPPRIVANIVSETLKLIRRLVQYDGISKLLFAGPLDQSADQYNTLVAEGFSKIDLQDYSPINMNAGISLYYSVLFNPQASLENRVVAADILCQLFRCRENRWTFAQMDPGWGSLQLMSLFDGLTCSMFAGTSAILYYQPAQDVSPDSVDLLEAILRMFATICMSPRLCAALKKMDLTRNLCRLMYYPDPRIYELSLVALSTAANYGGGVDEGSSSAVPRRPSPDLDLLAELTQAPHVVERMCTLITPRSSNLYLRGSSMLLALLANVPGGDLAVTRCGGIQPLINMLSVDDSNILYAACQVICGISQRAVPTAHMRPDAAMSAMNGPRIDPGAGLVVAGSLPGDIAFSEHSVAANAGGMGVAVDAVQTGGATGVASSFRTSRVTGAAGGAGGAGTSDPFASLAPPASLTSGISEPNDATMSPPTADDSVYPETLTSNVFTVNHMIIDELVSRKAIPEIARLLERFRADEDASGGSDGERASAGLPPEPPAGQNPLKEHVVGTPGVYSSFSCLTSWLLHALANVLPSQLAPPYLKRGSGILEMLCVFAKSCNPCIAHWACQCLANSCRHQDVARSSNQAEIVSILLSLVNKITRDAEFEQQYGPVSASLIVASACECLSCLLRDRRLAEHTGTTVNNAHYILVRALRALSNGRTRAWVCGAIAGLCEVPENTRVFLEYRIIEHLSYLCVEAGQLIQTVDFCLREQVCLAISAICRTAPLWPAGRQSGRATGRAAGSLQPGAQLAGLAQDSAENAKPFAIPAPDLLRDPLAGAAPAGPQLRPFSNLSTMSHRTHSRTEGENDASDASGASERPEDSGDRVDTILREMREKYGAHYGEASVPAEFGRRGVISSISSFLLPLGLATGREGVSLQELCCQRAAASATNALTAVGRNAILFYKEGCVEKLLYLMGHGDQQTRASAAGAIRNIRKALYDIARRSTGRFQVCLSRQGTAQGTARPQQRGPGGRARAPQPRYLGCFTAGREDIEAAVRALHKQNESSDGEVVEVIGGTLAVPPGPPEGVQGLFRPAVAIETLGSNSVLESVQGKPDQGPPDQGQPDQRAATEPTASEPTARPKAPARARRQCRRAPAVPSKGTPPP